MRIVSAFRQAPERALATLRRFPVVLLAGVVVATQIGADHHGGPDEARLMVSLLLIGFAYDATMLRERLGLPEIAGQLGVLVVTAAFAALTYLGIDMAQTYWEDVYGVRVADHEPFILAAFGLAIHALAAVIPFVGRERLTGFWQYNRRLFLRILTSAVFSGVLFLGLAVALWAIDALLGVEIEGEAYQDLFAFMAGVVNTWFFLAGVPESTHDDAPHSDASYPRGLKVFVQFVLLPLTAVYLVILYLYVGRIALSWNLPHGQVSYLIFSYAVVGILAYLLIYPLRDDEENRWIRTFARGFFAALAPLLVVLVVALLRRTGDYGITEPRYFGLVLAGWLALIVVYFLARREDIRIIPITLAAFALLTTFGPWSANAVAIRSQVNRLERIVAQGSDTTSRSRQESISSIASFLYGRGEQEQAARLRTARPDTVTSYSELLALFSVPADGYQSASFEYLAFDRTRGVSVVGFSEVMAIGRGMLQNDSAQLLTERLGTLSLRLDSTGVLTITDGVGSSRLRLDSLFLDAKRRQDESDSLEARDPKYRSRGDIVDSMPRVIDGSSSGALRARLRVHSVSGYPLGAGAHIDDFEGILMLGTTGAANADTLGR
jgi:hypothetical protein